MAKLSTDDVLKLANLSRIDLDESSAEEFLSELNTILEYVELLQSVDIDNLEPTSQVTGLSNVMRDDDVKDYGYTSEDLLKNVPHVQDDQIKVRRMIG